MSFQVEADTYEEAEAETWASWDAQYDERPLQLRLGINPALRQQS